MSEREVIITQKRLEVAVNVAGTLMIIACSSNHELAVDFINRPENWSRSDDGYGELLIHAQEDTIEEARRVGKLNAALAWCDVNHRAYVMLKKLED